EGLEIARRVLGEEHQRTLYLMAALGRVLRARGDYAAAEPLLVKKLEVNRRVNGEEHNNTLSAMADLVRLYDAWGKPDEVAKWRKKLESLKASRQAAKPDQE